MLVIQFSYKPASLFLDLKFQVRVIIGRIRIQQLWGCHNFGQISYTLHLQPMEAWIGIRNGFETCLLGYRILKGFGHIFVSSGRQNSIVLSCYLLVIRISCSWRMLVLMQRSQCTECQKSHCYLFYCLCFPRTR